MPEPPAAGWAQYAPLAALVLLIAASVWLGTIAQRVVERGSFMKGYFLGNRGLGSWALALTATVQSGGTFMGFPSLVYSHGWIVAVWIASYMVVPITGFGILGKRLAQLSRRTNAITVPDLFRERFGSERAGAVALAFILLFMSFMMVAQFKAGALIMKISWPGSNALSLAEDAPEVQPVGGKLDVKPSDAPKNPYDDYYLLGLVVFSLAVVGYTLIGGFLAAVWTDLFQSVMMFFGVLLLLALTLTSTGPEEATKFTVEKLGAAFAQGPGYSNDERQFMPLGLMISFFFVWCFAGIGSPAGMVRIMACKDTATVRRSIFLLSVYNTCIYLPLIVICICGRQLIPDLAATDEIIPRLAMTTTAKIYGGSILSGLILAAPFGAVMATVSSYLVVIASGLVHDFYQRFFNPRATDKQIRNLTYAVMIGMGAIAFAANVYPVAYLQALVVFSGTGGASTFVVPALMTAFWRRGTAAGAIAAMCCGGGVLISLYAAAWTIGALAANPADFAWAGYNSQIGPSTKFVPLYVLGLDPVIWGLAASAAAGVIVSLRTQPPPRELISRLFDVLPAK